MPLSDLARAQLQASSSFLLSGNFIHPSAGDSEVTPKPGPSFPGSQRHLPSDISLKPLDSARLDPEMPGVFIFPSTSLRLHQHQISSPQLPDMVTELPLQTFETAGMSLGHTTFRLGNSHAIGTP